jgi:hypothetical protein
MCYPRDQINCGQYITKNGSNLRAQLLMFTIPTALVLLDGVEALFFFGASFLGLRVSLFDFIWPFAMIASFTARYAPTAL